MRMKNLECKVREREREEDDREKKSVLMERRLKVSKRKESNERENVSSK